MANEERVRQNFVAGTTTDNPLTSGATTMNSGALATLEAIDSAEHAVITLDPQGAGNGPEIIYVTAHTGGATSATIVRGREGTSAVQHASGTAWVHGPTQSDYPGSIASSSERPASGGLPYAGQMKYEVDKHRWVYYDHSVALWLPFGGVMPACRVTRSSAQALTTDVDTPIQFNAETYDTDSMHDNVTNNSRVVINTPGLWRFDGYVEFARNFPNDSGHSIGLRASDGQTAGVSAVDYSPTSAAFHVILSVTGEIRLVANDFMELFAFQSTGATLNTADGYESGQHAVLSARWVAP